MVDDHQFVAQVDPAVWKACAGTSVQIPATNSRVYYFPQGHYEYCFNHPSPPAIPGALLSSLSKPFFSCRVTHVMFSSDPETDEVFAKIRLEPLSTNEFYLADPAPHLRSSGLELLTGNWDRNQADAPGATVLSFAKVLTASDANNGGGFSVPRFCADMIFPPLDYDKDPPVQNVNITDVKGMCWVFRHIYRGTPRRHLLTTGWSKFVNSKKLIAGDSVVFVKNKVTDKMFVGVRRVQKSTSYADAAMYAASMGDDLRREEGSAGGGQRKEGGFSRGKGKVSPESVAEAIELGSNGMPFEVVYYPRAGSPDFVVGADKVEAALRIYWAPGMRVKMALETEDSSRMTSFQGTVSSVVVPDNLGMWQRSPWRMLQVAWDEPEALQNVKNVSPWQVEYMAPTPSIHTAFPTPKRLRMTQNSGFLTDGEAEIPLPAMGFSSSLNGQLNPPSFLFYNFPAGMQGARQDYLSVPNFGNMVGEEYLRPLYPISYSGNNSNQKVETVSTELNIRCSSSGTVSPDSPSSVQCSIGDAQRAPNVELRVGLTSIQLFGKTIQIECPVANPKDMCPANYNSGAADFGSYI